MAKAYLYDLTDTWNSAGTTFNAIRMSVTDTASAAGSLLMNLQVGGLSQFNVAKTGLVTLNPALTTGGVLSAGTNAFKTIQFGSTVFGSNGMAAIRDGEGVVVRGVTGFVWENGANDPATGTVDLRLVRDAANTLAQRNGTNAQTFRVYETYTDASNYVRATILNTLGFAWFGQQGAGTGTGNGSVLFGSEAAAKPIYLRPLRTGFGWQISSGSHLYAETDNTYDIGAPGGSRPRNIYAAGQTDIAGLSGSITATAVTAGGTQALRMTTTSALGVYVGSGAPTVSAAKGSLYLRTDGTTTNDRMYVNTNGSTTWTAVTTVA